MQTVEVRRVNNEEIAEHFTRVFAKEFIVSPENFRKMTPLPHEYTDLSQKENEHKKLVTQVFQHKNTNPPTRAEIDDVIKRKMARKPDGAPGRDGITWRMVNTLRPSIPVDIFIKECWKVSEVSTEWSHDTLIALPKDFNKSHRDPSNLRPIFLQSVLMKIPDGVIDRRIQNKIHENALLHPEQGGFVRERGTQEQSAILREICCFAREYSQPLYIAFLDCKAAFDRVLRFLLFSKMHSFAGVDDDSWRILCKMYSKTTAQLGELIIEILSGIREGGLSSPNCYNIFTNDLTTKLKESGEGVSIGLLILICILLFADDIVLLSETPQGLQRLLDITWKFAKDNHMSFGIHKCAVLRLEPMPNVDNENVDEKMEEPEQAEGEFVPPDFEWKLGDRVLEVRKSYKYLGAEETMRDNYTEFLARKKKDVTVRLLEVQKFGGRRGGLRPLDLRKLYTTMVRPIIEFDLTLLPYNNDVIKVLETMQYKCVRQLFGFLPSTKLESMTAICGLPTIKMRMAFLKITFANKILNMTDGFYVKEIVKANWGSSSGIGADLRSILESWDSPEIVEKCSALVNHQTPNTDKQFSSEISKMFLKHDFEHCKHEIMESANRSGQAVLISQALHQRTTHSLLPQLRVQVTRSRMALFTNVLSGCDFVTPHNHAKKPKCKFCNASNTDWPHLLFMCPALDTQGFFSNYISEMETEDPIFVPRFEHLRKVLNRLRDQESHTELYRIMLGIDLEKYNLLFFKIIESLVSSTAKLLSRIDSDWVALGD